MICDVCNKPLVSQYLIDEWGNKFHPQHNGKSAIFCGCCGRVLSENTSKGYKILLDGRIYCYVCLETAITSLHDAEHQKTRVINLFRKYSFGNLQEDFPVDLIDAYEMSQRSGMPLYVTKGFAQSTFINSEILGRQVIANKISTLSYLPKEEFVGVFAHEYLHLWLTNNNANLSHEDTEGFCNIGSYLVYFKNNSRFSNNQLKRMETDMTPAYGIAYRRMREDLLKYGWNEFINRILKKYS